MNKYFGIIVSVTISVFGGAISTASLVGSMRADMDGLKLAVTDLARKQESHLMFHIQR